MAIPANSSLVQPFFFEGGPYGVLLIHGFTGSPAHMRPMGEALHAAGFTVQGVLLPGHGTTIQDMHRTGSAETWRQTALAAYDALAARCERVVVAGLSMGGVLSLLIAEQRHPAGCISIAAPMRLKNKLSHLSPLLGWAVPYTKGGEKKRGDDFLHEYDLGYDETPVARVSDLRRLMRDAERGLPELACPLLVAQSRGDEQVRPESAQMIYDRAGSTDKRLLWFERSGHVSTLDSDRERLFAESIAFCRRTLGNS